MKHCGGDDSDRRVTVVCTRPHLFAQGVTTIGTLPPTTGSRGAPPGIGSLDAPSQLRRREPAHVYTAPLEGSGIRECGSDDAAVGVERWAVVREKDEVSVEGLE